MKKITLIIPFLCFMIFSFSHIQVKSQTVNKSDIVGIWADESTKDTIEIVQINDIIFAKIYKLKVPNDSTDKPRTDIMNPDPNRRKDPLQGLIFIKNLNYSDGIWTFNDYYDYYDKGLTQPCIIEFKAPDNKDILNVLIKAQTGDKTTHWSKKKNTSSRGN